MSSDQERAHRAATRFNLEPSLQERHVDVLSSQQPGYEEQIAQRSGWEDSAQPGVVDHLIVTSVERLNDSFVDDTLVSQREVSADQPQQPNEKACCMFRDRRIIFAVIAVFAIITALVLGVTFGPGNVSQGSKPAPPSPTPAQDPFTPAPTSLEENLWQEAGGIDDPNILGPTFAFSSTGSRFAFTSASEDAQLNGTVHVYEEQEQGGWTQLGNSIYFDAAAVSLSDNRIAMGRINVGEVHVLELSKDEVGGVVNNIWTTVGTALKMEGWTVKLSRDGNVLAVEATDMVQVFELDENEEWTTKGDAISTETWRNQTGNSYSRMDMSNDGNTVVVDTTVYQYDAVSNMWTGTSFELVSSTRNTPVSITGNGRFVAISQPEARVNGQNSGRVYVFSSEDGLWSPRGDTLDDGQKNEFWGSSQSLSEDGSIAVMNDPIRGPEKLADLYKRSSQWLHWDRLGGVSSVTNGTIRISDDGNRVAIAGEGVVRVYNIIDV